MAVPKWVLGAVCAIAVSAGANAAHAHSSVVADYYFVTSTLQVIYDRTEDGATSMRAVLTSRSGQRYRCSGGTWSADTVSAIDKLFGGRTNWEWEQTAVLEELERVAGMKCEPIAIAKRTNPVVAKRTKPAAPRVVRVKPRISAPPSKAALRIAFPTRDAL